MPEPERRQRSPSVERRRTNGVPPIYRNNRSRSASPEYIVPRIPPIPPARFNPWARQLPQAIRANLGNPTGPNQTDAILYETKDLLRDLIQKATQIEQLLRIIHYSLQPARQERPQPPPAQQPLPDE